MSKNTPITPAPSLHEQTRRLTTNDASGGRTKARNLPAPLVPGGVDLNDFDYMPFEVRRLLRSQFWINAMVKDPRIAAVSINLYAEAWHQIPAGSLPNDDAVLARFAMVDFATWLDIRAAVLEPWVLCSDNRWYHPVLAEKAEGCWQKMRGREAKKEAFRKRQSMRAHKRWRGTSDEGSDAGRIAGRNANKGEEETEGDSENLPSSYELSGKVTATDPSERPKRRSYPAEFEEWWHRYPVKKGKSAAYAAFIVARRLIGIDGLHKGLDNYFTYKANQNLHPAQPHPWPASWLIGRRWEDGT